jgi:hypothetical protein
MKPRKPVDYVRAAANVDGAVVFVTSDPNVLEAQQSQAQAEVARLEAQVKKQAEQALRIYMEVMT